MSNQIAKERRNAKVGGDKWFCCYAQDVLPASTNTTHAHTLTHIYVRSGKTRKKEDTYLLSCNSESIKKEAFICLCKISLIIICIFKRVKITIK